MCSIFFPTSTLFSNKYIHISCYLEKTTHVLQSNGYILEVVLFEEMLHLIEKWFVCCRDYLCGTFCATCFFLLDVLYHVLYEMGLCSCFELSDAYLHCIQLEKTNTTWSKWRAICSRKASYWKGILLFLLKACYTLWMKVFVCKACSCQLESFLQEKDAWLVVFFSNLQFFHCLYQVWGKDRKLRRFLLMQLNHSPLLKGNIAER